MSERLNILACAHLAAGEQWNDAVMLIGEATWPFAVTLKNYAEWEQIQQLAVNAAVQVGDHRAEARFRSQLARAFAETGRPVNAQRESTAAIEAASRSGDPVMQASTMEFAGVCALEAGELENALHAFDQALSQFQAADIPRGVALQHYYAARALLGKGQPREALTRLKEGLDALVIAGDETSIARSLLRQGEAYLALEDIAQAVNALMAALQTATAAGNWFESAEAYELLAQTADQRGNSAAATAYRTNALTRILLVTADNGRVGCSYW